MSKKSTQAPGGSDPRPHAESCPARLAGNRVHLGSGASSDQHSSKRWTAFVNWFNTDISIDAVLKACVGAYSDRHNPSLRRREWPNRTGDRGSSLARSEQNHQRFYSMSAQIQQGAPRTTDILEQTQKADLDITPWLRWFLSCLDRAFDGAENVLADVLRKASFWEKHANETFNERQRDVLNKLLDGFEGKLTSSKWAMLEKCSQDTALRDIDDLIARRILVKDAGGGRSTSYSLAVS